MVADQYFKKLGLGLVTVAVLQACVHENESVSGDGAGGTSVREEQLSPAAGESASERQGYGSDVMKVESQDPKAVEIMNKDCDDGYDVLQLDNKSAAQVEAGVSMPVGKGTEQKNVSAFIYYRCKGRARP